MSTFEIGTGYKKTSWCSAEIICRGDCPQFTDSGAGVTVYHLYNVSACNYISKSSLVVDIRAKGATTWESWASYTMGGYEGFAYYWIEITGGIDYEFRATYKGITKYYSIVAPCVPNWQCEIPLNGYESDGCGNRRENTECVCVPNWQCNIEKAGYETDINNCGEPSRYNETCPLCIDDSVLPYYSSPGPETVIDEPGHYKGYFCAFCPGSGTPYDFKPPTDWEVISCSNAGQGTHGCCASCVVVLVELKYIGLHAPINCFDFCDLENHIKYSNAKCIDGICIHDIIENSEECGYVPPDPCEGIVCPDYCDFINHIKYINGQCIDGECIYDIIENSEECGFDLCEDVTCENICIGTDLYSQKCIDGECITDQLLEINSSSCGYTPPEEPPEEPPIDDELEPSDDLTKLIVPIGLGIGLLSLLKK